MWGRGPLLSGPLLCSQVARSSGGPSPSLGGRGGTRPQPPFPGLTLGPPGPGPAPCSLLEHSRRVAGFQLHVPSWAECQGAGPGLGRGPAGEIGQLGKSGGSRGGTRGRHRDHWAKEGWGRGGGPEITSWVTWAGDAIAQSCGSGFVKGSSLFLVPWVVGRI